MTTSFLDLPGVLPEFLALNQSRAHGAGLDPFEYDRVTAELSSLHDWPAAFLRAADRHISAAETAEATGHDRTAGVRLRTAACCFHLASLLPHPDQETAAHAAEQATAAMDKALAHLDPGAVRLDGTSFRGRLRTPAAPIRTPPPVVILIPGLDSSMEEFHTVTETLLSRGLAVLAIDGPGQGTLAAGTAPTPDYQHVTTQAINALQHHNGIDPARIALIGLSLGGYYAAVSAAHDPRVRATATISSPHKLDWDMLPLYVTQTLTLRTGNRDAACDFANRIDLTGTAERIAGPLLVVEGGTDITPGVTNGQALAAAAPNAELLVIPHGDHLLGNAHSDWLPATADWLVDHL